jgi:hypothetical protein
MNSVGLQIDARSPSIDETRQLHIIELVELSARSVRLAANLLILRDDL